MSVLRFVYDTAVSRGIMKSSAHSEHEVGYDVVALVNDSIGLDSLLLGAGRVLHVGTLNGVGDGRGSKRYPFV